MLHSSISGQDVANRLATLGDRQGPVGAVVDQRLRIEAQALVDGGADVGRTDRVVADEGGVGIGGAVEGAAANAGAGQHDRVAVAPVVAASILVDVRGPAEVA